MNRIGIIGSGAIGTAIARLAVAADLDVLIANSRGPESLQDLVAELGPHAQAGTVRQAVEFGDVPVLAIPLTAYPALAATGASPMAQRKRPVPIMSATEPMNT